jgi:hypothetical protein
MHQNWEERTTREQNAPPATTSLSATENQLAAAFAGRGATQGVFARKKMTCTQAKKQK